MAPINTVDDSGSNLSRQTLVDLLRYIHYTYPMLLLVLFVTAFAIHTAVSSSSSRPVSSTSNFTGPGGKPLPTKGSTNSPNKKPKDQGFGVIRSLLFCWLSVGLIVTFLGNALNVIVHALTDKDGWWCGKSTTTYIVASAFLYALFLISLVDSHPSPTVVHLITWSIALALEIVLFAISATLYTSPHHDENSLHSHTEKSLELANQWEIVELVCDAARVLLLVLCVAFYTLFSYQISSIYRGVTPLSRNNVNERTPLLDGDTLGGGTPENASPSGNATPTEARQNGTANGVATANGSPNNANNSSAGPSGPTDSAAFYRPTSAPARSWWEYIRGYSLFFPYLWPSKSTKLQVTVVVCFLIVLAQRFVQFLVPYQIGKVTNDLSPESEGPGGELRMPWLNISLFIFLKLLQGQSGLLGAARSVLWIPVAQYSYKALSTASFEHVHGLSLEFHLGKRTGEVLSALSKGAAINTFLEQVTFQVLPMLFDLAVAIGAFLIWFDVYYALTVSIVMFWYLYVTIRLAQMRAEQRRRMVILDREEDAVKNDSIMSYETVKYFGAEDYEFSRYRDAVLASQDAEFQVMLSLNVMNITQNLVFMLGLLVVSFIAAYQVTHKQPGVGGMNVGQFVTLVTYMTQLQQPLNFFGTFYRTVQSAMISGERLLELFNEQPTVVDEADAIDMPTCDGQIQFEAVKFAYDQRKPALENLSFNCLPGTTTALVGESGGGKSTVFRLLFRFYNLQEGSIQIDGHDVRRITIKSLRSHIGVVPQDTVLFNETLMYNLRYANQNATDEEIYDACKAASIHDKILAFPDGYLTKVGERGLRLSGGEKQRVAIARTILKNPKIIMLDEATAALDSETEQNIQEALQKLSEGRTMLVIAHRLSTITRADQILVLHQGAVAESGTHEQLLAKKGRYATMWKKQIRAEQAAEEARVLTDRAAALREDALARPGSRDGPDSEETSENEADGNHTSQTQPANSFAGRALGLAADGFRGAAQLVRGPTDDGRSTNNH